MDYSVIRTGGKQYIVTEGEELLVEKFSAEEKNLEFDTLLRVKGDAIEIGEPSLDNATKAEIVGDTKGKKVQGVKYMPSGYRRKFGHRQEYSKVKITQL